MKANRITPSSPIRLAKGSRKSEHTTNKVLSPIVMFAKAQIKSPAGAATATALLSTNRVLSKIDLTNTFAICGFLYGGNSSVNEDGTPFSTVLDNTYDISIDINIPIRITIVKSAAAMKLCKTPKLHTKNMVSIDIKVGNLPLHGTKLFVKIAISRSLGESIILHPVMPAALHPNPIHMVREICAIYFPHCQ